MFEAISDMIGGSLSDWNWLKGPSPISLGGLGTRRASLHAPAAFLSCLDQSKELVLGILGCSRPASLHIMPSLQVLISGTGRDDWFSIENVDVPLKQHALSKVIDQASFNRILDEAPDTRTKALTLSSAIPHAGHWLHVVPSSALGLHLHDQEFCHCLQYWLATCRSANAGGRV